MSAPPADVLARLKKSVIHLEAATESHSITEFSYPTWTQLFRGLTS